MWPAVKTVAASFNMTVLFSVTAIGLNFDKSILNYRIIKKITIDLNNPMTFCLYKLISSETRHHSLREMLTGCQFRSEYYRRLLLPQLGRK